MNNTAFDLKVNVADLHVRATVLPDNCNHTTVYDTLRGDGFEPLTLLTTIDILRFRDED